MQMNIEHLMLLNTHIAHRRCSSRHSDVRYHAVQPPLTPSNRHSASNYTILQHSCSFPYRARSFFSLSFCLFMFCSCFDLLVDSGRERERESAGIATTNGKCHTHNIRLLSKYTKIPILFMTIENSWKVRKKNYSEFKGGSDGQVKNKNWRRNVRKIDFIPESIKKKLCICLLWGRVNHTRAVCPLCCFLCFSFENKIQIQILVGDTVYI